ncbi:MAG: hypothetical protein M0T73_04370 [Deltaproteobacteria bacterium]|nr:hypothetical protein [Deltaproteobacteria bacterium]
MKKMICFKAGSGILNIIRDEGLKPERVRVFTGPAGGPKWFTAVGLDKALIGSQFLQKSSFEKVLLTGASAGAWRCLAMGCKDPLSAYEKLRIAYSRNVFTALDNPSTVSAKIRRNVDSFINDQDVPHILNHPKFDLAIHVVKSKNLAASSNIKIESVALILSAILNLINSKYIRLFYDKSIFYTGKRTPEFASHNYDGLSFRMNSENIKDVALATGSLPYFIEGVSNIRGAHEGVYRDGGLINYQLNEDYNTEGGLTLFFHYQERIIPGWFDKKLYWKKASCKSLERVLQIFPSEAFIKMLPDGKIPDRSDFVTFVNDPEERIKRWDKVCQLSELIAEDFMESVESGQIRDRVKPLFP